LYCYTKIPDTGYFIRKRGLFGSQFCRFGTVQLAISDEEFMMQHNMVRNRWISKYLWKRSKGTGLAL
jgi:hypothetical protein